MTEHAHVTIKPPPGRPCWVGRDDFPLIYLGWGKRDFGRFPVARHYDQGTTFYLVLKGELTLLTADGQRRIAGPCACVIDRECLHGIASGRSASVEILVWVWRDAPGLGELRSEPGGLLERPLRAEAVPRLVELHRRCRDEVARADASVDEALAALRTLVEVELARAGRLDTGPEERRWAEVREWVEANLAVHAPVPALCDYLGMSSSTVSRFFLRHAGMAPGAFFRAAKRREALRLIRNEGWTVKTTAFHLGYRHATDLSRALADR
jgi:AraC-like DNA-binding protein